MKKFITQVTKENGELKDVYIFVDNATAKALDHVDETTREMYLQDEYKMTMDDLNNQRGVASLDVLINNGFELLDEDTDVEETAIKEMNNEKLLEVIKKLEPQQQWIIKQVFYKGVKKGKIAEILNVSNAAISDRLKKIYRQIEKKLK